MTPSKRNIREEIRSSAKKLFATFGIEKINVEDILKDAQVSRKTFYQYFPSKLAVLSSFTEIRKTSDFQGYFEQNFPLFFRLTPQAKKEFFFEGCFEALQNPSELDLIYIQILQREEYLDLLKIDVQNCYKQNFEFMVNLFQEIGIEHSVKRAQLFLFLFDGILLNKSIFTHYKVNYPYQDWLTNAWEELIFFLNIKS